MSETTGDINVFQEKIKKFLRPGEEFILNALDENSEAFRERKRAVPMWESAQQIQEQFNKPNHNGIWQDVRLVDSAFDTSTGEPLESYKMLVGKRKNNNPSS